MAEESQDRAAKDIATCRTTSSIHFGRSNVCVHLTVLSKHQR